MCRSSREPRLPRTRPSSTQSGLTAPRQQCALAQARREKELRYPESTGEHGRARLEVLECETGGRWSDEAHDFLMQLARARVRSEPREIRAIAGRAWFRRWCTAMSCLRHRPLRCPSWNAEGFGRRLCNAWHPWCDLGRPGQHVRVLVFPMA